MGVCNISSLLRYDSNSRCSMTMPGTGDTIYVFDIDDTFGDAIPNPGDDGFYTAAQFANILKSRQALHKIDIKSDSGQVTSEKGEDTEGRSLVGTAIVDHNIVKFQAMDEAMSFRNMGALFPDNNGNYYVIMSSYKRTQYTSNYDSGTTYDSDHGFTITFTVSPVYFGCPKATMSDTDIKAALATDGSWKEETFTEISKFV